MTLLDEVGIDVGAHVGRIMLESFGERVDPAPVIAKVVRDERKGRKNERGFYFYGEAAKKAGKGKHVDPSIYAAIGQASRTAAPRSRKEDIQLRCSLQFVNEALLCFGEKILRSARDGDVGAVMGLGFPPFRGGPFRLVDEMGATDVLRRMRSVRKAIRQTLDPGAGARRDGRSEPAVLLGLPAGARCQRAQVVALAEATPLWRRIAYACVRWKKKFGRRVLEEVVGAGHRLAFPARLRDRCASRRPRSPSPRSRRGTR